MAVKVTTKKPKPSQRGGVGGSFGTNSNAPLDMRNPQAYGQGGLPGFFSGIAGGISDVGDALGNFLSGGAKGGDQVFGAPLPVRKVQYEPAAPTAPKKSSAPTGNPLLDYLQQAASMFGGVGGSGAASAPPVVQAPDYSGLADQATSQAGQIGAQLQAMYNALHNNINADATPIAQTFDNATQAVNGNQQAATGDINNAYQAARDAQTAQLQALGIGDAAGVLASQGSNASNDQAQAVSNVVQGGASSANQLAQNKGSALDYNTNIGNAALQQGTDKQSAVQMALQSQLAQIAQQQQAADAAAASQNAQIQAQYATAGQGSAPSPSDLLQFAQALQSADPNSTANKTKASATEASQQQALLNSILKYMSSHPGESYAQAKKDLGIG